MSRDPRFCGWQRRCALDWTEGGVLGGFCGGNWWQAAQRASAQAHRLLTGLRVSGYKGLKPKPGAPSKPRHAFLARFIKGVPIPRQRAFLTACPERPCDLCGASSVRGSAPSLYHLLVLNLLKVSVLLNNGAAVWSVRGPAAAGTACGHFSAPPPAGYAPGSQGAYSTVSAPRPCAFADGRAAFRLWDLPAGSPVLFLTLYICLFVKVPIF